MCYCLKWDDHIKLVTNKLRKIIICFKKSNRYFKLEEISWYNNNNNNRYR